MIRFLLILFAVASCHAAGNGFRNSFDYEARRWTTNVVAAGGSVSGSSYRIATIFMQHIKQWGLKGKIRCCNLYMGTGLAACLWPIIQDQSLSSAVNVGPFVSGDYSESTGLTGDGVTKYINGNWTFDNTADQKTNAHIALYNRTASDAANVTQGEGTGTQRAELAISVAGTTYFVMWDVNAGSSVTDSTGTGFYLATRRSDTDLVLYKNASAIATNSSPGTSGAIGGAQVHTLVLSGSSVAPTARTLCFYGFGNGITATDQAYYWKAVQRVQISLGRQIGSTAL